MKQVGSNRDDYHPLVKVRTGNSPIILSAPHGGMEIPPEYEQFIDPSATPPDILTDVLAEEIAEEAEVLGLDVSAVIDLGARSILELNWGRERAWGIPELEAYFDAYYRALHDSVDAAVAEHGFAVVIDVHGYHDGKEGEAGHGLPPAAICLGTRYGGLIPRSLLSAFEAFRGALKEGGYTVYPEEGFDEYGSFIGGTIVESFRGEERVAAVQVETPLSLRRDAKERKELAGAIAGALDEFVKTANKANTKEDQG